MKHKTLTVIYGFLIGAAMIATWVMLFATGQAEEIGFHFGFHLFSELLTATFMIAAGGLILAGRRAQRWVTYFGFGLLLNATLGAFTFYIVNFNIGIFLMSFVSFALTVVLAVLNYEKISDLIFLTLGVIIYACLNIGGQALGSVVRGSVARPMWGTLAYVSLALVSALVLMISKIAMNKA